MILLSPSLYVGKTDQERELFIKKAGTLNVRWISSAVSPQWTEKEAEEAKRFLDNIGIRVGEISYFPPGFGSPDKKENEAALNHYRKMLRLAGCLDAHCIGIALNPDRGRRIDDYRREGISCGAARIVPAEAWSEDAWNRCLSAVKELARDAESMEMDIAAHSHLMTPLYSPERHRQLIDAVASPRLKLLLDPVNLIHPYNYFQTTGFLNQLFDELGDSVTAVHAKDAVMLDWAVTPIVTHIDEAVPGTGVMDYATFLKRTAELRKDITFHVEHFTYEDTVSAQQYIRYIARNNNIELG